MAEKKKVDAGTLTMFKIAWRFFIKGRAWFKSSSQNGKIDSDELLQLFKFLADSIQETYGQNVEFNVKESKLNTQKPERGDS